MKLSGAAVTRIQEELARREEQVPIIGLHQATEDFIDTILEIISNGRMRECEQSLKDSWIRHMQHLERSAI